MTLKKLLGWALVALLIVLASIAGQKAFGEEKEEVSNKLHIIAGDDKVLEAAQNGTGTIVCSDDKNALSRFSATLGVDVPKYRYYSLNIARGVHTHAKERYSDATLGVTYRDDIPDSYVASFCVAFNTERTLARNAKVIAPMVYRKQPALDMPSTSAPVRHDEREMSEANPEPQQSSPLANWNSALTELRSIARQVATRRDISRTEKAVMEDDLKSIRDILDNGPEGSADGAPSSVRSSSDRWNTALENLRTAATDIASLELSKSTRSAMKADLKDVENALNRKKSNKKKLGVF